MLNIITIIFTLMQIAKGDWVLIVNVRAKKKYVNGVATNEIDGYIYDAVLPLNSYERISIKVNEDKPSITQEDINTKGGSIKAKPKNFEGKFYRTSDGNYAFSSTASAIEVM